MITKVFDAFVSLIFAGTMLFGARSLHDFVKREALIRVSKGLSSTYRFSQALTHEKFDWEK